VPLATLPKRKFATVRIPGIWLRKVLSRHRVHTRVGAQGDGQQLGFARHDGLRAAGDVGDSPTGWPQRWKGKQHYRADGRPAAQWSRLKAGYSDDLGTGRR
jgi:hypothetical protein